MSLLIVALMLQVNVALPSGKRNSLSIAESSKVGDLKRLAQKSFEQGFLRLVTAEGRILADPNQFLQAAGLKEGDHLTAIVQQAKMAATDEAFAIWCHGGDRIVTWGRTCSGGDSFAVQDQLRNVQQVHATSGAFAAILADGSVVAWGHPEGGAVIVLQCKISWGTCSKFRPQTWHLPQSWPMDQSIAWGNPYRPWW